MGYPPVIKHSWLENRKRISREFPHEIWRGAPGLLEMFPETNPLNPSKSSGSSVFFYVFKKTTFWVFLQGCSQQPKYKGGNLVDF